MVKKNILIVVDEEEYNDLKGCKGKRSWREMLGQAPKEEHKEDY